MSTTHHIQSQQIQLSFQGSEREAFGLQEQMSQHFQREMIPVMEQVFDRLVGPDRHLQLDQLEIDLGQWGAESWSGDDFLRRFAERLESALKTQLGTRNELANFSQQSNNVFQAWLHFLEKGVLPWHKRKLDQADYLFIAEQLSTQANPRDQLRRLLKRSPKAQQRLLLQHPLPILQQLFTTLNQQLSKQTFALYELLLAKAKKLPNEVMGQAWERQFWEVQMQSWIVPAQAPSLAEWQKKNKSLLIQKLLPVSTHFISLTEELRQKESVVRQAIQKIIGPLSAFDLAEEITPSENAQTDQAFGEAANIQEPNALDEEVDTIAQQITEILQTDVESQAKLKPSKKDELTPLPSQEAEIDLQNPDARPALESLGAISEQEGDYFLSGAGVILCHAYLNSFWQRLDWVQTNKFQDLTAQELAVLSLHYLAFGEREAPEYRMILPKLLCGLPLNHPLNVSLRLNDKQAEEAENLLAAIIQNWGALGEVSNESLRTGFLQRPGKLSLKSGRWRLLMERQTLDVLLDRLPWSIGIVKLPWMPEPIMVDWN